MISSQKKKLTILGIGPATNIPVVIERLGADSISAITLMSGVIFDRGNITEFAEFNAYNDPISLNRVLQSGIRVNVVPLDICRKVVFQRNRIQCLARFGKAAQILMTAHDYYMKVYQSREGIDGCFPNDSIALLAMLHPERFVNVGAEVEVEESGIKRGNVRFLRLNRHSNVNLILGGDLRWVRGHFV